MGTGNGENPNEIRATYRVVTPLFCGGADPTGPAELRLASFKGVLRFWWRALAWSRLGGDLNEIKRHEDALFGSAAGGQSRVIMRFINPHRPPDASSVDGHGARYLGYGVIKPFGKNAGTLLRPALAPFNFEVGLRLRGPTLKGRDCVGELRNALIALGTLGGMGARSRKGYGAVVLRGLTAPDTDPWKAPNSIKQLRGVLHDLLSSHKSPLQAEYTALTSATRCIIAQPKRSATALEALDIVGREIVRFRSKGRKQQGKHKILGDLVDSEYRYDSDHKLMISAKGRNPVSAHPKRVAFGLPHNYAKEGNVGPTRGLDRRASPLLIHVHEVEGAHVVVLSLIESRFLPSGVHIKVGRAPGSVPPANPGVYQPVHDFLDRLLNRGKLPNNNRKETYTKVLQVQP